MVSYLTVYLTEAPNSPCLAIPALAIRSLLAAKDVPLTSVPQSPKHVDGMFSWGGEFLAVCALATLLSGEVAAAERGSERVVVLDGPRGPFAVRVARLGTLISIAEDQCRPSETLLGSANTQICPQVHLTAEEHILWLVDVAALDGRARGDASAETTGQADAEPSHA